MAAAQGEAEAPPKRRRLAGKQPPRPPRPPRAIVRDPLAHGPGATVILDGGLATHIEELGEDIDHSLWSARCLISNPGVIRQAHADYYSAGANVAITASYQAHLGGFRELGLGDEAAVEAMKRSVRLAREAAGASGIVAGSVGSYGASLHNGAEYTGDYPGMDEASLVDWHRLRMSALIEAGCDILACETIPCLMEARALVSLLGELRCPAWITFSCRSESEVSSGESYAECVAAVGACDFVMGAGVNCTKPEYVAGLVSRCRAALPPAKHVVIYPNSGEEWCGEKHEWKDGTATADERFVELAKEWRGLGADCIGGCCRTSPRTIAALRAAL